MSSWPPFEESEFLERAPGLADGWDELRRKLAADRSGFSGRLDGVAPSGVLHAPCPAFQELSGGTGSQIAGVETPAGCSAPTREAEHPAPGLAGSRRASRSSAPGS